MLSLPKQNNKFWRDTVSYFWGDTLPKFLLTKEKNMKVNPIRDRILVKPIDADTVSKGGIVIPDNAKEKPIQGKVLGVGTGKITEEGNTIPLTVKEGDVILFGKFSGQTVRIDNEDHIILNEDDVLAIVE